MLDGPPKERIRSDLLISFNDLTCRSTVDCLLIWDAAGLIAVQRMSFSPLLDMLIS